MPYPNERRKHAADPDDVLSPEFLAMLVACGGEVRAEDRPTMPGTGTERRRRRADDDADTSAGDPEKNRAR